MGGSLPPFAAAESQRRGPTPLSISVVVPAKLATVAFDQPLTPATLDPTNWALRYGAFDRLIDSAAASGTTVTLRWTTQTARTDPEGLDYTPPPYDVTNLDLLPAPGFTGFPVY